MKFLPVSASTSTAGLADLFKMMAAWKKGKVTESDWHNWANSIEVRWELTEGLVR
jgi:type III restriction enzyme